MSGGEGGRFLALAERAAQNRPGAAADVNAHQNHLGTRDSTQLRTCARRDTQAAAGRPESEAAVHALASSHTATERTT